MRLTFNLIDEQKLIFTDDAVAQMTAFAQHCWHQREAGGVLLGRHLLDSGHIVIDEVTTPQPKDRRSRYAFFRSEQHNRIAQQRWESSKGTLAYLGLWHTHPERIPSPSPTDCEDWNKAVAQHAFFGDILFFPIVGTDSIRVWAKARLEPIRELSLTTLWGV